MDIANECRQYSKQDRRREAEALKKLAISTETVAQRLARTGQFVSADACDSKSNQASKTIAETENEVRLTYNTYILLDI